MALHLGKLAIPDMVFLIQNLFKSASIPVSALNTNIFSRQKRNKSNGVICRRNYILIRKRRKKISSKISCFLWLTRKFSPEKRWVVIYERWLQVNENILLYLLYKCIGETVIIIINLDCCTNASCADKRQTLFPMLVDND